MCMVLSIVKSLQRNFQESTICGLLLRYTRFFCELMQTGMRKGSMEGYQPLAQRDSHLDLIPKKSKLKSVYLSKRYFLTY